MLYWLVPYYRRKALRTLYAIAHMTRCRLVWYFFREFVTAALLLWFCFPSRSVVAGRSGRCRDWLLSGITFSWRQNDR